MSPPSGGNLFRGGKSRTKLWKSRKLTEIACQFVISYVTVLYEFL
jgi:hypothetical protein